MLVTIFERERERVGFEKLVGLFYAKFRTGFKRKMVRGKDTCTVRLPNDLGDRQKMHCF